MSEFGAQLKQARERRGISLRQIATSTKIAITALDALERDDFSRLPGGIFSRAFVRAYAIEVGLDPEKTVEQFLVQLNVAAEAASEPAEIEVSADDRAFLARQQRASRVLRVSVIVVIILAVAGVVAWRLAAHGRLPGLGLVETSATGMTASAGTGHDLPAPSPSDTPTVAAAPAAVTPPSAPAVESGALVVDLQASAACSTRVTVDGKVVLDRNLTAGEHQQFSAAQTMVIQVGDAGAITWTINGKEAKAMGGAGDVRTVRLAPDTIAAFLR